MYVVNQERMTLKEPRQEMMGGKYLLELAGVPHGVPTWSRESRKQVMYFKNKWE